MLAFLQKCGDHSEGPGLSEILCFFLLNFRRLSKYTMNNSLEGKIVFILNAVIISDFVLSPFAFILP